MNYRFRELRERLKKTSKEMAADLSVSESTITSWVNNHRNPRPSNVKHATAFYHLNPGWLEGRTDQMYQDEDFDRRKKQVMDLMTCKSDFAVDTILRLAEASSEDWEILKHFLK